MLEILTWADGKNSLLEVAEKSDLPMWDFYYFLNLLKKINSLKLEMKKQKLNENRNWHC